MGDETGRRGSGDAAREEMLGAVLGQPSVVDRPPWRTVQDALPPSWSERAVVGLGGVVRVRSLRLVEEVAPAGDDADGEVACVRSMASRDLLALADPFLRGESLLTEEQCLLGIEAMHVLMCRLAEGRLHAAGELSVRAGEALLEEAGVSDPDEMSRTAREKWRGRCKAIAGAEVAALTGWGRNKSRELVAIALSPSSTRSAVRQGLDAGLASWWQVDKFWRETRMLPHEDAALVARALFATDVSASEAAVERLDPEGALGSDPWQDGPFAKALQREITRARGTDPAAEAKRRAARHEERNAYALVDDDGTGQVVVTGDGATSAACADRLHLMATRLRQSGDPRTLSQLRADLAHALLLHGTLPLTGAGETRSAAADVSSKIGPQQAEGLGDDLISPEELERLAQVIGGTPSYHLQVIVPWDALAGQPVLGGRCTCGGCTCPGPEGAAGRSSLAGPVPPRSSPFAEPAARAREGVGHVLARTPLYLSAGALREMALAPGTTLSRILFDAADGRCVERSVARYRPDAPMREQILAADVTSRGFGSATLARDSQLDHVLEYLTGGATSEQNLQALDLASHIRKTRKEWKATIDALRNVSWTSFFGRVYRTRSHDYRQYLSVDLRPAGGVPDEAGGAAGPVSAGSDGPVALRRQDRRHLASALTYAALTVRLVGEPLEARDDDPDGDDYFLAGRRHPAIWLRRTRERDGRKVDGPRPGTPTPEQILATPPQDLLRATHWTEPFAPTSHPGRTADLSPVDDDPPPF